MNKILEIATNVSTPLMLAGFLAGAFFLILRQILEKGLFPRLTRRHSVEIITLSIKLLFILALVATLLGFVGFALPFLTERRVADSDASPLVVESFEVRHYRYEPANNKIFPTGSINKESVVREYDDVTVHATFSLPSYIYLVSLDADGHVRLRIPDSPNEAPALARGFDYPSDPVADADGDLYFLKHAGMQGFMLLVSDDPLPAWSDWIDARTKPTWTGESLPNNGVLLYDGIEMNYTNAARGAMPRRGKLMPQPIIWARSQHDFSDVRFFAFHVQPKENTAP